MSLSSRPQTQAMQCELAAEVLRSQQILHLHATGRSMLPTIWPGDTLVIERLTGDKITTGEIVLFTRNGQFVAHRVVAIHDGEVQTQGDAAPRPDAPQACSGLAGKVSMIVRNGRLIELGDVRPATNLAWSALLRRSDLAARVVLKVHGIRLALRERVARRATSQPSSRIQVSPCRN